MASKKKRGTKSRSTKKAKAGRSTRNAARAKPKAAARVKSKAAARSKPKATARAKARSRKVTAVAVTASVRPQAPRSDLRVLDEAIEESLVDVSGILRVKDAVARSQRDIDEDELKQFSDPSLVVEVQKRNAPREEAGGDLPDLFAAEARRQKARQAGSTPETDDGSLFGTLNSESDEQNED